MQCYKNKQRRVFLSKEIVLHTFVTAFERIEIYFE